MAIHPQHVGRDARIARGRLRVDIGRGAARRQREHLQQRATNVNLPVNPAALCPRLQPVEIGIGAEAQRIEIAPEFFPQFPHGLQVHQVQALLGNV